MLDPMGWSNVSFDPKTLREWTRFERVLIGCLPELVTRGVWFDDLLDIIAEMDLSIERELVRLREAAREATVPLRGPMFAISYVLQGPRTPGISVVCSRMDGRHFKDVRSDLVESQMMAVMDQRTKIMGQIKFLASLSRSIAKNSLVSASFLAWALENCWDRAPYHLRLTLADAAGCCWGVPATQRSALVAALESRMSNEDIFLNTPIFESLQRLGALEAMEEEHTHTVRKQLSQLLEEADDEAHACESAYGLYICQFDHPYSNAYCEAIGELPDSHKNRFLLMAGSAARDSNLFLPVLLAEVIAIGGTVASAILRRWTRFPPSDGVSPQEAMEAFVVAHTGLGLLAAEMDGSQPKASTPPEAALRACGVALYWSNRQDLPAVDRRRASAGAWDELRKWELGVALAAMHACADLHFSRERWSGFASAPLTILEFFPTEAAEVCRRALENPDRQIGYFRHFESIERDQAFDFAVKVLGDCGNSTDLPFLRGLATSPKLGRSAVNAIRVLEARLQLV